MKALNEYLTEIEPDIIAKAKKYHILGMKNDDVAQILRLHLFEKFAQFNKNKSSWRTWANKVMQNRIKDLARRTDKEWTKDKDGFRVPRTVLASQLQQEEEEINTYENFGDGGGQVKNTINEIDSRLILERAKINEEGKTILQLHLDGYSFREIGKRKKIGKDKVGKTLKAIFNKTNEIGL